MNVFVIGKKWERFLRQEKSGTGRSFFGMKTAKKKRKTSKTEKVWVPDFMVSPKKLSRRPFFFEFYFCVRKKEILKNVL